MTLLYSYSLYYMCNLTYVIHLMTKYLYNVLQMFYTCITDLWITCIMHKKLHMYHTCYIHVTHLIVYFVYNLLMRFKKRSKFPWLVIGSAITLLDFQEGTNTIKLFGCGIYTLYLCL